VLFDHARTFTLAFSIVLAGPAASAPPQTPVADAPPPNVAASVNGHIVSMDEVTALVMRENGGNATTRLIENYLVDEEAKAKQITVSSAEIDGRVQELVKLIAPTTLEEGLRRHHQSLDDLESDIRQWFLRVKLVSPQVKPGTFVRARIILIKAGNSSGSGETPHSDEEALALVNKIQIELNAGKKFEELAKQYNEDPSTKEKNGETGVLFAGVPYEGSLVDAALTLKSGEVTQSPVKSNMGYYLIQATSTAAQHVAGENQMYAEAEKQYAMQEAQMLIPGYIKELREKAKIINYLPE
jgi:hypothetical protein